MNYHCVDCGHELERCSNCPTWLHSSEVGLRDGDTVLCRPCAIIYRSIPAPVVTMRVQ